MQDSSRSNSAIGAEKARPGRAAGIRVIAGEEDSLRLAEPFGFGSSRQDRPLVMDRGRQRCSQLQTILRRFLPWPRRALLTSAPEPAQGTAFCPGRVEELFVRIFDVVFTTAALLLMLIPILVVAALVKINSPGPVFFVQERLGRLRVPFRCIKFRTMFDNAEQRTGPVRASRNDARVTGIGRFLRRCRLDELPQLWNVLRGDMSIVGPRPIRRCFADQLVRIDPLYDLRFAVKPGITGWAQVKYRYATTDDEELIKCQYDIHYIENRSLLLNAHIILLTISDIFGLKGT